MRCRYLKERRRSEYQNPQKGEIEPLPTVSPPNLILRDDDLTTIRVFRSGDGVVEETDCANDLAFLDNPDLSALGCLAGTEVGRIADDLLGFDDFVSRTDAHEHAFFVGHDFVNGFIEHISTAVDGGETCEGLG